MSAQVHRRRTSAQAGRLFFHRESYRESGTRGPVGVAGHDIGGGIAQHILVDGSLDGDSADVMGTSFSGVRLWMVMRRVFLLAAKAIEADHAPLAEMLRRASPHWMRQTHALGRGAELTTVRDTLRHASVSTTSIYLHSDEVKRARQIGDAFSSRK